MILRVKMKTYDCHCWLHYPNERHKHKNGKWKCVDDYECVRDLVEPNLNYYNKATHCRKKKKDEGVQHD